MLKKKRFTCSRALLPVLLLGVLAAPAFGQDEKEEFEAMKRYFPQRVTDDFRVGLMLGTCFHAEASSQSCPLIQVDFLWMPTSKRYERDEASDVLRLRSGLLAPRRAALPYGETGSGGQLNVLYSASNTWPDPDPPVPPPSANMPGSIAKADHDTTFSQLKSVHDGTLTGTVELALFIPVQRIFLVEPFLGIGVAHIFEGEAEASNRFAVAQQTMFAASYGVGVTARIAERWDLRFQFRGTIYFPGELEYIGMERDGRSQRFKRDVATVSTSSLLVGIGVRFPK